MKKIGSFFLLISCFFSCKNSIKDKDLDGIWSIKYIMKDSTNLLDYYNYTAAATFTNPLYKNNRVNLPCRTKSFNEALWRLNNDSIEFFNSEHGDLEGKYHVSFKDETWRAGQHWLILRGDSISLFFTKSTFKQGGGSIDFTFYPKLKIDSLVIFIINQKEKCEEDNIHYRIVRMKDSLDFELTNQVILPALADNISTLDKINLLWPKSPKKRLIFKIKGRYSCLNGKYIDLCDDVKSFTIDTILNVIDVTSFQDYPIN